ncbi:MAG: VanZ family protein [Gammaproteobacteria bacterium]|nr:VanZ family protein [Gammaproteobacteria bacterium]
MIDKQLKYKKIWIILGLTMIAFVVFQTLTSSPVGSGLKISDKLMHIVGYFGMMGWFVQIFNKRMQQLWLAAGFIILGVVLEFLQGWGGIRHYELADMLANATGVILAWIFAFTRFSVILLWIESGLSRRKQL